MRLTVRHLPLHIKVLAKQQLCLCFLIFRSEHRRKIVCEILNSTVVLASLQQQVLDCAGRRLATHSLLKLVGVKVVMKNLDLRNTFNLKHKFLDDGVFLGEVKAAHRPLVVAAEEVLRVQVCLVEHLPLGLALEHLEVLQKLLLPLVGVLSPLLDQGQVVLNLPRQVVQDFLVADRAVEVNVLLLNLLTGAAHFRHQQCRVVEDGV